jgi:hypothetical protein
MEEFDSYLGWTTLWVTDWTICRGGGIAYTGRVQTRIEQQYSTQGRGHGHRSPAGEEEGMIPQTDLFAASSRQSYHGSPGRCPRGAIYIPCVPLI